MEMGIILLSSKIASIWSFRAKQMIEVGKGRRKLFKSSFWKMKPHIHQSLIQSGLEFGAA